MRQIKFRAWDKRNDRMRDWDDVSANWAMHILNDDSRQEWMQFTGLLDKNGREIYEGDILRLHCGPSDGTFEKAEVNASVVWKEDRFTVEIPDKEVVASQGSMEGKKVNVRTMHSWCGGHTCLLVWQSKLEVIGNIYENPDLLK